MGWTCKEEMHKCQVRRCEGLDIVGMRRGRSRPKKYWEEVIRSEMAQLQPPKHDLR